MKVDFLDLKSINTLYKNEFEQVFSNFLNSGSYLLGNQLIDFENRFAGFCGVDYTIGTGNGLDALTLVLRGYLILGRLKPNDEVLVPANTFVATILSVLQAGLKPVLLDPNETTFNLDAQGVIDNITKKTKVIIVTHLYGQLAPMNEIRQEVLKRNLILIADGAQAHGATYQDFKIGELADATSFSFYPSKNLGALGDGGAVVTSDKELAECIFKLRNYGCKEKYKNEYIGVNSRLDEIQAAFLSIKLKFLNRDNDIRRNIAKRYLKEIKNSCIELPFWDGSNNHVFYVFVVRVKNREHFIDFLKDNFIGYVIHYPIPPHKQEALNEFFRGETYPITEKMSEEVLSIPLNPILTEKEITYVINTLNKYKCSK